VRLVYYQKMIPEFFSNRAYPALGIGIHIRRSNWCANNMKAGRFEHIIKGNCDLVISIYESGIEDGHHLLQASLPAARLAGSPMLNQGMW